jgi:hypothetical protein
LSPSYEGSVSEKTIVDEQLPALPPGSTLRGDLGFLGYRPKETTVILPTRKPRGKPLSDELKADNREKARQRVVVEHAIGGVKISRIVKDTIRMIRDGARDLVMELCCGLHNLRCSIAQKTLLQS